MRIFFIGCLTFLGIGLCILDFSYGQGLAYFSVLEHGYGFAWNLLILFVGVATGSYLMQDLVQEGQENYLLYRKMFSKWESTRDKWKSLEDILSLSLKNSKKNKSGEFSLVGMEVVKRSSSGRVKELEIRSNFGKVILRGDEIRSVLRRPVPGNPPLRSTLFKLKIKQGPSRKQDIIIATGAGYGHGIGLCQMGAIGMSTKGYQYDKILKHYYRDIDIYRAY